MLVGSKDKDGYIHNTLSENNRKATVKRHRLVAELFVDNPNPNQNTMVNHINEVKGDNRAENLEWCNQFYNDLYGSGIEKSARKQQKKVFGGSLSEGLREFSSLKEAADYVATSRGNVSTIALHYQDERFGNPTSIHGWTFAYDEEEAKNRIEALTRHGSRKQGVSTRFPPVYAILNGKTKKFRNQSALAEYLGCPQTVISRAIYSKTPYMGIIITSNPEALTDSFKYA